MAAVVPAFFLLLLVSLSLASLHLRTRVVETHPDGSLSVSHFKRATSEQDSLFSETHTRLYLVHLLQRLSPSTLFLLQTKIAAGSGQLVHVIPDDGLLVRASPALLRTLADLEQVDWVGLFEASDKYGSASLLLSSSHRVFHVALVPSFADSFVARARDSLHTPAGVTLTLLSFDHVRIACLSSCQSWLLGWVAQQSEVIWLEPHVSPVLHNSNLAALLWNSLPSPSSSCSAASLPLSQLPPYPLSGEGQVAGLADSGLDMDHCFFFDPDLPRLPLGVLTPAHRKVSGSLHRSLMPSTCSHVCPPLN
jgi:hypothetical protein